MNTKEDTNKPLNPPAKVQAFADNNGIDPRGNTAPLPPMPVATDDRHRMSEGETPDREEFLRMRALIQKEDDVLLVLGLSWVPSEQRWLYLIKTPFATWPKYVVGFTDSRNDSPEIIFRCGSEANGRECFNEQNFGDHL